MRGCVSADAIRVIVDRNLVWPIVTVATALLIGVSSPAQADDFGNFLGSVVGGVIGQAMQQPRPQPTYQYQPQPYPTYQQPDAAAQAEARRQYLAHQAELKRQKQLQQQDAAHNQQATAPAPVTADNTSIAATTTATGGSLDIPMKRKDGNLWVPAQINKVVTIDFVIDSGASDITLPRDVYLTLIRSGTLTKADFIGDVKFGIADGSEVKGVKFKLASLQVGNQVLTDVVASVMPSDSATPLLGLSFLSRFQSWSIDNGSSTLKLTPTGVAPAVNAPTQVASTAPQPLPDLPPGPTPGATAPSTPDQLKLAAAGPGGPRSGNVPTSALIVKDADTPQTVAGATPQATTPSPKPDTASVVPSFPVNTTYANARTSLMALGYGPAPLPDAGKCDTATDSTCFPERQACAKVDNNVQCDFFWRRGDQVIKVKTVAVPPTVSEVECQVNCK
jgi:clan AA aspartic protease (TIGR02281 family)